MNITILQVGLSWTRQLSCDIEKEGKRKSLQSNIKTTLNEGRSTNHYLNTVRVIKTTMQS